MSIFKNGRCAAYMLYNKDTGETYFGSTSNDERPEHVKDILRKANNERSKSVLINGVQYPSVNAAANALNVDNRTIDARCRSINGVFNNWQYI